MQQKSVMSLLGYAGLIPFFIGAITDFVDFSLFGLTGLQIFTSYSVVILSFLCGTLWGRTLNSENKNALTIISNLLVLLAWFAFLIESLTVTLLLLAAGFIFVLLSEIKWLQHTDRVESNFYPQLRFRLTSIVVVLHLIVIFI